MVRWGHGRRSRLWTARQVCGSRIRATLNKVERARLRRVLRSLSESNEVGRSGYPRYG
jgi:hypothetical protein